MQDFRVPSHARLGNYQKRSLGEAELRFEQIELQRALTFTKRSRDCHTAIEVHPSQIACGLPHDSYLYSWDWIKYAHIAGLRSQSQANSSRDGGNTISLSEELSHCGAQDVLVTTDLITSAMSESLSKLTVITESDFDAGRLLKYGVDSLVSVEVRNWFTREIGVDAGVFEAMANISKWELATDVAGWCKLFHIGPMECPGGCWGEVFLPSCEYIHT